MLWKPDETFLLVVDVQEKLMNVMPGRAELLGQLSKLIRGAQILGVPVIVTEQAPEKLGGTVPEIAGLIDDFQPFSKLSFSCCGSQAVMGAVNGLNRKRVLICGVETHVCVYQTAADLAGRLFDVQVVVDASGSRKEMDRKAGLARIKDSGVFLTTVEMILCELLARVDREEFKPIIGLIK